MMVAQLFRQLLLMITFLALFVFACEDEKDEATSAANCATLMAEMEAASDAFEANQTKANCDKVVEKAEAVYNCMPDGPEKTEMRESLDEIKGICVVFS